MEGARLGPYQLRSELGSGGMGKVYRAEVAGTVPGLEPGRTVAVKVIHAHLLETPGFFKRFLREADIGRTIEHENVVRTYDCDALLRDGVQQNFLVMEYVEGQTLRDLLHELERVPEELCRHIGREVATGLAAIHGAGVVHRDLKPENVLITPEHVVKIMDLGVARLQAEAIRLSQTGAFVGSLEYAAPEQFRSADGDPDGRADLHALGVALYELSTGKHPYRDEDVSKVLHNILDAAPRKLGELNPQLSPFFEEVVHTLLAKDRDERFAAAADVARVFEEGEESAWWRTHAQAIRAETKRPLRRIRIPRETALYGREEDLARLRTAYERARGGEGQVLLIEGEAGIGKTRLVDEFVGQLQQDGEDVNFLFGSYPPGGAATAAGAFSTAYRTHFGDAGLEEALQEHLKPTPVLIPAFAALLRGETSPTGAEPLTKGSLQTVFVHATRGLAADRPTIVLIDDLHFAPEDGRALFASLAMAVPDHRVLLVGTMRPGVPEDWIANVERLEYAARTVLSRLGPKDLMALLRDSFHSERLANELAGQIAVKSDGNPFFAFEIIRGLREAHSISQKPDGTWVTTNVVQDIHVPSSVTDLVQARTRDLQEEEKDLLDVASCCGFTFDPGLIAAVVGLARLPALKRFGSIEQRHRLIRSTGRTYTFDHHQVQEALYSGLHAQMREEYHTAIGEALEARAGARDSEPGTLAGELCVDLCEHFLKGGKNEGALRYLHPALHSLLNHHLHGQVVELAERALSVPDLLVDEGRLEVLEAKASALHILGRPDEGEAVLAEARPLAEATGKAALGRIENATGNLYQRTSRCTQAMDHYLRYREIARETGNADAEAAATINLGMSHLRLDHTEDARALLERGLELAIECGNGQWEANARGGLGILYSRDGRIDDARRQHEKRLTISREIGDRRGEAGAENELGNWYADQARYDEARPHYEQTRAISREIGFREGEALAAGNLGNGQEFEGRYADAAESYEWGRALSQEIGDRRAEAGWMANLGELSLRQGRLEEAKETLEAALPLNREYGDRQVAAILLRNLGRTHLALGDRTRAGEVFESALLLCEEGGLGGMKVAMLRGLGAVAEEVGDEVAACSRYEESLALGREADAYDAVVLAASRLANLPEGDAADAVSALEEHDERLTHATKMEARFLLWKATADAAHLHEAKRLLDHLVEHAPEDHRESMLGTVRLHRDIAEAAADQADRPGA